jgi:hypothetical protein
MGGERVRTLIPALFEQEAWCCNLSPNHVAE